MIIYIIGMSCVGKTTIGKLLAKKIENYYGISIEKLQGECFTMNGYREKASIVLDCLLTKTIDTVISGTPSGLKFSYLQVYKKHKANKDL